VVTVFGAGTLIQHYPVFCEILRWTGVAYLLFLAWEGWWSGKENSPGRANLVSTAGPLLVRGFLSNVFNPKSILFFVSVVPIFVRSAPGDSAIPLQIAGCDLCRIDRGSCDHCDAGGEVATVACGWTASATDPSHTVDLPRPLWPSGWSGRPDVDLMGG
jgi:hypothetical protein